MSKLPISLNIAIVDTDKVGSSILKIIFEDMENVDSVCIFEDSIELLETFESNGTNALLVDIFGLGTKKGIKLIENVREKYPKVPICLLGERQSLLTFPNVTENWKIRFGHYYKLSKDQVPEILQMESEQIVYKMSIYYLARTAKVRLRDLRNMIAHGTDLYHELSPEKSKEIEGIVSVAEQALDVRDKNSNDSDFIVPGFDATDVQILIKETLEKTTKSLETTANVNKAILIFGAALVSVSFIVANITGRSEAIAFGGFGMAGIIASLITNPLKSIGSGARQLVQIHVAYFGFLSQLKLLNPTMEISDETLLLARSKQLGEEMKRTLETLEKYFG